LPLFRFREVYGPFFVSATLLFWAYIAALILLFGADLSAYGFFQHHVKAVAYGHKSEDSGNPPPSP